MDSAESLFSTKGFNGTSRNGIVKESGLSKGAIYGHFESKERLFLSLWERQTVVGIGQLRQMFSPDETAVDKLLKVAEMTMASSCDCPPEVGRMQLEFMVAASRMKALEPDMQKRYETIHTFINEIFEEGVENGEFRKDLDSDALTSILFASLDGLGVHYATLGIEFDAKRLQDTLMKVVLEGILA
ncbi:TetR/AcrR family transcriptional regulator [Candidatus Bathyarchaeota archaeon]|nr:TetR/AcrR family transcriptional regulator [Candidatus Bathyarchaeota archaeon]